MVYRVGHDGLVKKNGNDLIQAQDSNGPAKKDWKRFASGPRLIQETISAHRPKHKNPTRWHVDHKARANAAANVVQKNRENKVLQHRLRWLQVSAWAPPSTATLHIKNSW